MNLNQIKRELLDVAEEIKKQADSKYEFAAIRAIQDAVDCLDKATDEEV